MVKSNNHKIEIVKTEIRGKNNSTSKSFVIPGTIRVKKNDEVTWVGIKTGAKIIFPKEELFGKKEIILCAGNEEITQTVLPSAQRKAYPYIVITDEGDIAIGGSYPVIIVD